MDNQNKDGDSNGRLSYGLTVVKSDTVLLDLRGLLSHFKQENVTLKYLVVCECCVSVKDGDYSYLENII